jgi:hypothetical protein
VLNVNRDMNLVHIVSLWNPVVEFSRLTSKFYKMPRLSSFYSSENYIMVQKRANGATICERLSKKHCFSFYSRQCFKKI